MNRAKTAEPIDMPLGKREAHWTKGTMYGVLMTLAPPGEYDWTIRARRRRSFRLSHPLPSSLLL